MINLYPLEIAVIHEGWRLFSVRKADRAFDKFKTSVFERDCYTCQYCGFQAKRHMEVVNLDRNYRNNKLNNMVTACCFCSQCFFLEAVGREDYGGGTLIYLPEISQGDLNGICHVLFCVIHNENVYKPDSQNIYQSFKERSQLVEKNLGEGMYDPALFGRMLMDVSDKDMEVIQKNILPFIRLLPSYSKFSKQVGDWAEDALDSLSDAVGHKGS